MGDDMNEDEKYKKEEMASASDLDIAYAEAADMEPSIFDCVYAALSNADDAQLSDIAEIITGAIEMAQGKHRELHSIYGDCRNGYLDIIKILAEIYEYDSQDPVQNGWVGSDGRP